ncbi:hypothetical protein D3C80_1415050 [compost metagenome]
MMLSTTVAGPSASEAWAKAGARQAPMSSAHGAAVVLKDMEGQILKTEVQSRASFLDAREAAEVLVFRRGAARWTADAAGRGPAAGG